MRWRNLPIPETIVAPLLVGSVVEFFFPLPLFRSTTLILLLTVLLLGIGLFLMIWSVIEAGKLDVSSPDKLLADGPYSLSRNPMYVSWLFILLASTIFTRSAWLILSLVVALLLTHFLVILPEERYLHEKFGDSFVRYCEMVRRYI